MSTVNEESSEEISIIVAEKNHKNQLEARPLQRQRFYEDHERDVAPPPSPIRSSASDKESILDSKEDAEKVSQAASEIQQYFSENFCKNTSTISAFVFKISFFFRLFNYGEQTTIDGGFDSRTKKHRRSLYRRIQRLQKENNED